MNFKEIEKLVKPYYHEGQTEIDITAVLKYIEDKVYFESRVFIQKDNIVWDRIVYENNVPKHILNAKIPRKPLHLYNTKQEKDLLQLLLKLNK